MSIKLSNTAIYALIVILLVIQGICVIGNIIVYPPVQYSGVFVIVWAIFGFVLGFNTAMLMRVDSDDD